MLGIKSVKQVLSAIADLITRTKGLNDTHDDLGTHETAQSTHRAVLVDIHDTDLPAVKTDVDPRAMGRKQIKEVSVTSAANAGDVVLATVTTQPCLIESVVIHADAAQTGDLISCGVFGGAGKVITFISAADAVQANLDAEDKQVAWTGAVRLAAGKTIVISLVGSNGTTVDLTVTITFRSCVWGGVM